MTLQSNNEREYVNHDMHNFLSQHSIVHHTTCIYTPQQNGVAERKNRHLLEVVHASLFEDCLPHHFFGRLFILLLTSLIEHYTILFSIKLHFKHWPLFSPCHLHQILNHVSLDVLLMFRCIHTSMASLIHVLCIESL
jgi:transposase InsO family protein